MSTEGSNNHDETTAESYRGGRMDSGEDGGRDMNNSSHHHSHNQSHNHHTQQAPQYTPASPLYHNFGHVMVPPPPPPPGVQEHDPARAANGGGGHGRRDGSWGDGSYDSDHSSGKRHLNGGPFYPGHPGGYSFYPPSPYGYGTPQPPPLPHFPHPPIPNNGAGYLVTLLQQREQESSQLRNKIEILQEELQAERLKTTKLEYQQQTLEAEHAQALQLRDLKLEAETAQKQHAYQQLRVIADQYQTELQALQREHATALEQIKNYPSSKSKSETSNPSKEGNNFKDEESLGAPSPPATIPKESPASKEEGAISIQPPKRILSPPAGALTATADPQVNNGAAAGAKSESSQNDEDTIGIQPPKRVSSQPATAETGGNTMKHPSAYPEPTSMPADDQVKEKDTNDDNATEKDEQQIAMSPAPITNEDPKEVHVDPSPQQKDTNEPLQNNALPVTPNFGFREKPLAALKEGGAKNGAQQDDQKKKTQYFTSVAVPNRQLRPEVSELTWEHGDDESSTVVSEGSRIPIQKGMGSPLLGRGAPRAVPLAEKNNDLPQHDDRAKNPEQQEQERQEIVLQPLVSTQPETIREDSEGTTTSTNAENEGGDNSEDKDDSWSLFEENKTPSEDTRDQAEPVQKQEQKQPEAQGHAHTQAQPRMMATSPAPLFQPLPAAAISEDRSTTTSTFGDDRAKVVNKVLADPFGDMGIYTGVILLSTGLPHGTGRMQYSEPGRTYDGEWRHGRWHGFGKATFSNGDSYEGMYASDQRNGKGVYKWSDGRVYDGEFQHDRRYGKGTFIWPDGAFYDGDFVNGQREGHGIYIFADGGRYEGGWENGRYNGVGTCVWADGRRYHGEWKSGLAHGQGIETFADGTVRHEGEWANDEPIA